MNDSWAEQFVDTQVGRAWLDLRMHLADRFAAGLATGDMEPIDISTATGETLTVDVDVEQVVIIAGEEIYTTDNVDEAAYAVFQVLHDDWQVVHPVFLDSLVVDAPAIPDNPIEVAATVLGKAASTAQLQAWVVAAFSERRTEPLKVAPNGNIHWRTKAGHRVTVTVSNAGRVEFLTVLGRNVGFKKARKVIDELNRKYCGLKFFLVRDTLLMSQVVVAYPFAGDQLHAALRTFLSDTDSLGWVADRVLRKRVKDDRAKVVELETAKAPAESALARAEAELATARRVAARRKLERAWVSRKLERASAERDEAQAELDSLKSVLERALGHQTFCTVRGGGEAA